MKTGPKWQYDELKACGVDYSDNQVVAAYDGMHRKFRDYAKSTEDILCQLALGAESTVIDMGAGTGAFTLHAAGRCHTVYAVDVSAAMLAYTQREAERAGLTNIVFRHGGLLTYEHEAEPVDAMVCVAVLHHLPDFWKQVALLRCCRMLKPHGRLFLFDIVFPSGMGNVQQEINGWIETIGTLADSRLADEAGIHVKEEFSTYDWILEGILRRSGFHIESAEYGRGFQATYVCTRATARRCGGPWRAPTSFPDPCRR